MGVSIYPYDDQFLCGGLLRDEHHMERLTITNFPTANSGGVMPPVVPNECVPLCVFGRVGPEAPKNTQFKKGVSGNPYGRKTERHFVESILSKVLFSATAPTPGRRSASCTNMEAMVRAMVMKALEGDVVAFREVMEWVCEFGIGMESRLAARKLTLELQSHLSELRKR